MGQTMAIERISAQAQEACIPPRRAHYPRVSITLRLVVTGLLLLGVAGCQTPSRPLATVEVQDSLEIAPAAPIEAGSLPPVPVVAIDNSRAWPTNWVNAWIPLESWGAFNGLGKPRQVPSNPHPKFEFQTASGPVAVKIGSRIAQCNGLECWLGFAPQIISGQPYIHSVDAVKNLQPILQLAHQTVSSGVIVIDPGHGGQDVGTQNLFNRRYEKDYTLDWALRLKPLLTSRGWKVLLTRTTDVDVSLADRIALAEHAKADLFLSLHFNSGHPNHELSGIETYCLTPPGMPSHLVREYDDNLRQVFPNNAYDEENFMLALRLHRSMVQNSGAADRGVRRARFMSVLRGQNRPAVLIEAGYLSNQIEAQRIATPEYRQLLAEAVAKGL
jgi:N-acetylmuramoyl-L-alanine amidase